MFSAIHRWVGLGLGLVFLVTTLTGAVLVYRQELVALSLSLDEELDVPRTHDEQAEALRYFHASYGPQRISYVLMPKPEQRYYVIGLTDGSRRFAHPTDYRELEAYLNLPQLIDTLRLLHTEFYAGDLGKLLLGVSGLWLGFMALSGIYLWLPVRKAFRSVYLWPSSMDRPQLMRSHWQNGVVFSATLLFSSATGAALVFNKEALEILSVMFDEEPTRRKQRVGEDSALVAEGPIDDWPSMIEIAYEAFPQGHIGTYVNVGALAGPLTRSGIPAMFRMADRDDWAPNGSNRIYIDPSRKELIRAELLREANTSAKVYSALYPLHSAAVGGGVYKLTLLLVGVGNALVVLLGLWSWCKKKSHRKLRPP